MAGTVSTFTADNSPPRYSRGMATCGTTNAPFSPTSTEPDPGSLLFPTPSPSTAGTCPAPSYHVSLSTLPAVCLVPGNSYTTFAFFVHTSRLIGGASARTLVG